MSDAWLSEINVEKIQYRIHNDTVSYTPTVLSLRSSDIERIVGVRPTDREAIKRKGGFLGGVMTVCDIITGILGQGVKYGSAESMDKCTKLILRNGKEYRISNPEVYDKLQQALSETSIVRAVSKGDTSEVFRKPLLIDGNNIVRYDKSKNWRVLKTLIDWLKKNERDFFVYFDASIEYVDEHVEMDADGKAYLHALIKNSAHAKKCPAGDEADKFILYEANKEGNHILSNDTYGQWEELYPWIKAKNNSDDIRRVHRFQVKGDILSIPDLGVYEMVNSVREVLNGQERG